MGLFDSWRRKRVPATPVKLETPARPLPSPEKNDVEQSTSGFDDVNNLVSEYEYLIRRREELQQERKELTNKLDQGQLDANEFRQHLMDRIQEAAQVSENLRIISTKLTSLGFRGVLH